MDTFNRLADDFLIHILSFLSTEEAAVTSILSKRWRNLWKLTRRVDIRINSCGSVFSFVEASRVSLVDSVLFSFCPDSLPIHEFCVQCNNCGTDIARDVERWISLALHHKLQALILALNLLYDGYRFPPVTNGVHNLVHLQLSSCKRLPSFDHFPNLRTIILWRCLVTDGDFESIKLNCTFLKVLAFKEVHGLRDLRISNALYHLRHLEIACHSLQTLLTESPNLALLVYNWKTPVEHIFAPRLRQVYLRRKSLSSALSLLHEGRIETIHKLTLEVELGPQNFDHSRPCPLNYVKDLSLKVTNEDLTGLEVLLRACSSLESLNLLLTVKSNLQLPLTNTDNWKHTNLQRIHIHGFCWTQYHLQIVKFLVEFVIVLKEIIITPAEVGDHFDHVYDGLIRIIAQKLSQGLKLVILPARATEFT